MTDRKLADSLAAEARRLAPSLSWEAVARRYVEVAGQLVAQRSAGRMASSP
jgi:hypothetical protein